MQRMDKATRMRAIHLIAWGDPEDCWPWLAGRSMAYGRFNWVEDGKSRTERAHRLAWWLAHGSMPPEGMCVCHACDNPICCNPHHLFLGTRADNMQDMARKGRARNRPLSGEKNGNARLTESDVREIRASSVSANKLAREYGVSQSTISRLRLRETWASTTP
jgi:hypothetical protein